MFAPKAFFLLTAPPPFSFSRKKENGGGIGAQGDEVPRGATLLSADSYTPYYNGLSGVWGGTPQSLQGSALVTAMGARPP